MVWLLLQVVTLEPAHPAHPAHKGAEGRGTRVSILDAIELGENRYAVERRGDTLAIDAVVPIDGKLRQVEVAADGRSVTMRDTGEKAPKIPSSPRVLAEINALRAAVGLSPVALDPGPE